MNRSILLAQGEQAAAAFDECDTALTQLNEAFGVVYEANKKALLESIYKAHEEGLDLDVFSGPKSLFKFPDQKTQIIVVQWTRPTPHDKLEALDIRIEKKEQELKILKEDRKALITKLTLKGEIDKVMSKMSLTFKRLAK